MNTSSTLRYKLLIDNRERTVIAELEKTCQAYSDHVQQKCTKGSTSCESMNVVLVDPPFTVLPLDLGDAAIVDSVTGCTIWLFERKTLGDLAASIVDGRHRSQTLRLANTCREKTVVEMVCEIPERSRSFLNPACNVVPYPGTKLPAKALRSAIMNNIHRDGFRAHFTKDQAETASHILSRYLYMTHWIEASTRNAIVTTTAVAPVPSTTDQMDTSITESVNTDSDTTLDSEVRSMPTPTPTPTKEEFDTLGIIIHKKRKGANTTDLTMFADMLNAIPGLGPKLALAIAKHFGSMSNLIRSLESVRQFETTLASTTSTHHNESALKKQCTTVFEAIPGVGSIKALSVYRALYGAEPHAVGASH